MNKFLLLGFLLLNLSSLFSSEIKIDDYKAWKEFAIENPQIFLEKIDSIKLQNKGSIDIQLYFLNAFALEKIGEYAKVDSLISKIYKTEDFSNDSLLYFNFLSILVDQRKITDDFESALKFQYLILDYNLRSNDTMGMINSQIYLGEIYRALENFPLGLKYLNKATKNIYLISGDFSNENLARIYNRKAAIFLQENLKLDSVEYYSKEAIKIAKEIHNKDLEAVSSNELGFLYYNTLHPDAETYLRNAINIWEELGYHIYATNAKVNLCRYFEKIGEIDKAIIELKKSLKVVEESNWNWEKGPFYELLGRLYSKKKDYKNAFLYTELSRELLLDARDKLYSKRLTRISNQLELRNKENELLSNKKLLATKELTIEAERDEKFIYIVFLIAVGIIAIIFYYSMTRLSRQRNLLTKQKAIISRKNTELKGASAQKDALLKEINHRVKNNLSILSSLLYLQEKDIFNPEAKEALQKSQVRIHSISLIHESLYQRDDMESVNFQDYLTSLGQFIKSISTQEQREVNIIINCEDLKPELSQSVSLGMILNEYMTNSFKYAFKDIEKPIIKIDYKNHILTYSDNGPGYIKENKVNSLGLKLIEIFITQLNAKQLPSNLNNTIIIDLKNIK